MPESFDSRVMAVLDAAQDEARRLGYGYVASEHLLLGLIREAGGRASRCCSHHARTRQQVKATSLLMPDQLSTECRS